MTEGVVLLGPTACPSSRRPPCYELFGCATLDDLRERWAALGAAVDAVRSAHGRTAARARPVDVETADGSRRLRLELYPLNPDRDRCVAIVRDRELVDAAETDFRLATQFRALSRLSAAVAHDLKAPLAAVLLHLELLRGTLTERIAKHGRPVTVSCVTSGS